MKKIIATGFSVLLLASCIARPEDDVNRIKAEEAQAAAVPAEVPAGEVTETDEEIPVQVDEKTADASDYGDLRRNIIVKGIGKDYIVYEYSDVRIDQVAPLAARFCYDTNPGKKAYLRDIYMHRNHKRRATFDCVDLASE